MALPTNVKRDHQIALVAALACAGACSGGVALKTDLGAGPGKRSRLRAPARPLYRAGRNEPCPCGSGKKFKRCCIGKTQGDLV